MKKTWITLALGLVMALALTGCGGSHSAAGDNMTPDSPVQTPVVTPAVPSNDPTNPGDDDLAGADGIVGNTPVVPPAGEQNRMGRMGPANDDSQYGGTAAGRREDHNALEDIGRGVKNALDDLGEAAQNAGMSARQAVQ